MMFHNTEKTETCHGNVLQILLVTRMAKLLTEAGFISLIHKVVFIVLLVDWCVQIRLHMHISLLEQESLTGSTLLCAWGATSIQWNILMPQLHLVADIFNHYEKLIQN